MPRKPASAHEVQQRRFDGRGRGQRLFHRKQVAAVKHHDAALGDFLRHRHADLLHLDRLAPADEGRRALQRMRFQQLLQVVGQGVVDRRFHVAVKAQQALALRAAAFVVGAVVDVVAQHLFVPAGKGFLAAKVRQHLVPAQPLVAALAADGARRD